MFKLRYYQTNEDKTAHAVPNNEVYTASVATDIYENHPKLTTRIRVFIDEDEDNNYYAFVNAIPVLIDTGDVAGEIAEQYLFAVSVQRAFRRKIGGIQNTMIMNGPSSLYVVASGEFQHFGNNYGNLKMISIEHARVSTANETEAPR